MDIYKLDLKQQLNLVNASYLFTHISYLEKTYTTTAQEPSIYVKRSRQIDHLKTGHFQPFGYRTTILSGIQMNPVFGCPVFGWLLYSVRIRNVHI